MTNLELELRELAAQLDVPPTPPLSGAVLPRITRRKRRRRALALAVAFAATALAVAFAVPSSRASLLRFFHLRGATVALVDRLPPLASRRSLGQPIAPDQAGFRLLLPSGGFVLNERALSGGHFEFRGGAGPRLTAPERLALDPRAAGALESALSDMI